MTALIVGASGATGKHLVGQLLAEGHNIKVVVRSTANIPESWQNNPQVDIIEGNVSDISVSEMAEHIKGCEAVACCLGHNLTFKGIYGKPRRLVKDAVRLLCEAIKLNGKSNPVKVVLMNTTGNRNRDLKEPISVGQHIVIGLLRLLLPPHVDNEQAADYLRVKIGQNDSLVAWSAVRPDGLINEDAVSEYEIHPSPTRSAIFNAGKVSRINVGHFMAKLITDDALWQTWKGQMPVIYSRSEAAAE
jgi:hypothetical protein